MLASAIDSLGVIIVNFFRPIFLCASLAFVTGPAQASEPETLKTSGLTDTVEIIKDKWGVSHIYAQNQSDLFFTQGYNAARDRLFQFEIWRRKATGSLSEIMGEKAVAHDKGARLLRFRGDINAEMAHYHSDGAQIITSFVRGVNAYITLTERKPELLPFEFKLLGIKPGHWTPEIVVSRHNALTGGISSEIMIAKTITALGAEKTRAVLPFEREAYLVPFEGVDLTKITDEIMAPYRASRSMPVFDETDLAETSHASLGRLNPPLAEPFDFFDHPLAGNDNLGSNNWVLSGDKTRSGKPLMANDPHRRIQSPSLRYLVHLNAPAKDGQQAWNVIGAGEPVLPGISIGHNDHGAWGLTIFRIDQEDLYVYETNPDNPNQYRYNGEWKAMTVEHAAIKVRGQEDKSIDLKYSVHGPILMEDKENHLAYGLKAAWLDIGATPYLASLRMDQATTWEEFREACSFSGLPGENMVWADKNGNIGWQSVGLAPVRFGWDGSLPIPGNGTYEWQGYVPIRSMPHVINPKSGWYGTANHNNVPAGYPNIFSDFYSDPARSFRLKEVLPSAQDQTIEDSMALQYDTKSMTAEKITPYILQLKLGHMLQPALRRDLKAAVGLLKAWDHRMDRDSAAAAVYDKWELAMLDQLNKLVLPEGTSLPAVTRVKLLHWVTDPPELVFGPSPKKTRDRIMLDSLESAVAVLNETLGSDPSEWAYGKIHYAEIIHPLSHLLGADTQRTVNIKSLGRGGAGNTLNANHGDGRQRSGASFRIIVDTADWDTAKATNGPGQSADPRSPHYADLFEGWNKADYFPLFYSKEKVLEAAGQITNLVPD